MLLINYIIISFYVFQSADYNIIVANFDTSLKFYCLWNALKKYGYYSQAVKYWVVVCTPHIVDGNSSIVHPNLQTLQEIITILHDQSTSAIHVIISEYMLSFCIAFVYLFHIFFNIIYHWVSHFYIV